VNNFIGSVPFIVMIVLAFVLISFFIFKFWKKINRDFKFGVLFFLLTFSPYVFFVGRAQRLLYLPFFGISLAFSSLILFVGEKFFNEKQSLLKKYLLVLACVLLVLNFTIIQRRSVWWKESTLEVKKIISQAGVVLKHCPKNVTVNFSKIPRKIHQVFVFNMGFEEAMNLYYPDGKVKEWGEGFENNLEKVDKKFFFVWDGEKFVRIDKK
jgi:signal transduction histidine kinase